MDTVRIKSSHPPSQGPFVVLNAADFDPAKHELWGGDAHGPPARAGNASSAPDDWPDDWESLPWFSLRKMVEDETGIRPKNKAEAVEIMRARQ